MAVVIAHGGSRNVLRLRVVGRLTLCFGRKRLLVMPAWVEVNSVACLAKVLSRRCTFHEGTDRFAGESRGPESSYTPSLVASEVTISTARYRFFDVQGVLFEDRR